MLVSTHIDQEVDFMSIKFVELLILYYSLKVHAKITFTDINDDLVEIFFDPDNTIILLVNYIGGPQSPLFLELDTTEELIEELKQIYGENIEK